MLSKQQRAGLIETFGEKAARALESILAEISKAADDAGIEKKENLVNQFVTTVIKAVDEKHTQESTMITKDFDLVEYLKGVSGHKEKAAQPAPSGPSPFAPHYFGAGVPPIHGGSANKEAGHATRNPNLIDGIFGVNQGWGQPPAKGATIFDFIFGLNEQYGKGDKR